MKDPHIHVEKGLFFTHQAMRELVVKAIGLAPDAPKTVTTGCNVRRPYAMTSTEPEKVTCLACRDYARDYYDEQAAIGESLMAIDPVHAIWDTAKVTPAALAEQAGKYRALAARFKAMP